MRKVLGVSLLSLITFFSEADSSSQPLEIKRIERGWGADAILITPDIQQQLEGCSGNRFRLEKNSSMFDQDFSLLLSAYHAKSRVVLRVSGCVGNEMNVIAVALIE